MIKFKFVFLVLVLTLRSKLDTTYAKSIKNESNIDHNIPIANDEVTGEVFKKALVRMEKNRGKPIVEENEDEDELKPKEPVNWDHLNDWEKKYMDMPVSAVCSPIIEANFLEIKGQIKLVCKAIALQIQGKSVEEIRVTGEVFKEALVWMEKNRGKPIVEEDEDEDELKPKEPVNWDHLNDWEKKCMDIPVSEMIIGKLNKSVSSTI